MPRCESERESWAPSRGVFVETASALASQTSDLVGAPASDLIAAAFEGQVEPDRGSPVIVSTATEEVRVAPAAIAEKLRAFPGRTVTLHGWIVDAPQGALLMVVTRFEVEGDPRTRTDAR